MKKIVMLLFLLCWALPAISGPQFTYRPKSTYLPDLPKYALAGANTARSQELFTTEGGPLPLAIELNYNNVNRLSGELGVGWSHSYEVYLHENPDATMVMTGGVEKHFFFVNGTGYQTRIGDHSTLRHNGDGTWTVALVDGLKYHFGLDRKLTSIVDRNGKTVSVDNALPNQKTIVDPSGRQTIIHYSGGKIDWIRDPKQGQYDFTYNPTSGMLETVTEPPPDIYQPKSRPVWEYRYTADDQYIEYAKDPQGRITKYCYTKGRLSRKVDPAGVIDMNGAETTDAARHSTNWAYGFARGVPNSRAVTRTEKDGRSWVYHYADGVLVSVEGPSGDKTQHSFYLDVPTSDPRYGLPKEDIVQVSATILRVTAYVAYDAKSNPTEIKEFSRNLIFDGNGNLITTRDGALGRHLLLTYDDYGRVIKSIDLVAGTTIVTPPK